MPPLNKFGKGNQIIGTYPVMNNSSVHFNGENNILYCEENVRLKDSTISFNGNNSVVFLGTNRCDYKLELSIYNDCVFHMGRNNYINNGMTIVLSESKHCFIGDNGIFSNNICIRNADPHLIYSCESGERLNLSRSIFIGDHVWIGQGVMILKGTQIDSGSIVGAMSVVSGKRISHNSSWAGNPCRQIKENVFWDNACVHAWTADITENSQIYADFINKMKKGCHNDFWIYDFDANVSIDYDELDKRFSEIRECREKCRYLIELDDDMRKEKNRFVHKF